MINSDSKLHRNDDVLATELGENLLMMSVETGNYHELDDIASVIWRELETPLTVGQLSEKLCSMFKVSQEQCLDDIIPFLGLMRENKLLVIEEGAAKEAM